MQAPAWVRLPGGSMPLPRLGSFGGWPAVAPGPLSHGGCSGRSGVGTSASSSGLRAASPQPARASAAAAARKTGRRKGFEEGVKKPAEEGIAKPKNEGGGIISGVKNLFGRVEDWVLTSATNYASRMRSDEAMTQAMVFLGPRLGAGAEFGELTAHSLELEERPDGNDLTHVVAVGPVSGAKRRGEAKVEAVIEMGELTVQRILLDGKQVPMRQSALPSPGGAAAAGVIDV